MYVESAVARIIGAALLFSTGGAAIKMVSLAGMQVASLRSGIAAVCLLTAKRVLNKPGGGDVAVWSWSSIAVGFAYAATLMLFVSATKLTTSANAIFIQSTAPLYIAVLAPFVLREPFRQRDGALLIAVSIGLAMCFAGGAEATVTAPDPATGNVLAVLCSLAWAFTLMGLRWCERRTAGAALSAVVAGNILAFAAGAPNLWPLPSASAGDWVALLYLGACQIGLAYILLTQAVRHLPALHVSLLLLLEPVLNPLWTWLVQGENPGGWTLAGGAVIIAATAGQAVYDARMPDAITSQITRHKAQITNQKSETRY